MPVGKLTVFQNWSVPSVVECIFNSRYTLLDKQCFISTNLLHAGFSDRCRAKAFGQTIAWSFGLVSHSFPYWSWRTGPMPVDLWAKRASSCWFSEKQCWIYGQWGGLPLRLRLQGILIYNTEKLTQTFYFQMVLLFSFGFRHGGCFCLCTLPTSEHT